MRRPAGNAQDNARFGENHSRYLSSLQELILYAVGTVWSYMYSRKDRDVNNAGTFSRNEYMVIPWNALPEKVVSSKTALPFKIKHDKCGGRRHTMCEATQVNSGNTKKTQAHG